MNQHVNPKIEWKIVNDEKYLYFTFDGVLTGINAKNGVETWRKLSGERNEKKRLVWNCIEMKGYEPMARSVWQRTLKELKSEIDCIWLITHSGIIKAGARLMSVFTAYDIKIVSSERDIRTPQINTDTMV